MSFLSQRSIVTYTDAYKVSMYKQYPPGTEYVYSYIASRGGVEPAVVNAGIQVFVREILMKRVTRENVEFGKVFWEAAGYEFNYDGWMYILNELDGKLPLKVVSADEGLLIPTGNIVAYVVNTDPNCHWLTTWVETAALSIVWYMSTVATNSNSIKRLIKEYLNRSGDPAGIGFKLHDFSMRGVSSEQSAIYGGMAHLMNFMGTDNMEAVLGAYDYYDAKPGTVGFSIPAAEHSTITSWGRDNEALAYENMVRQFSKPGSIYAVVSDSYNIYNAVENIWGEELRDLVINSGGTLVIRPDSGDPLEVLPRLIHSVERKFGATRNEKGYKVLNNVRFLWGDGINRRTIASILRVVVDVMGFSADNIAFGMGGALLQIVNRDDQKFAMKCSAINDGFEWIDVYKDPVDDPSKKSLKGLLDLVMTNGEYRTVPFDLENAKGTMLRLRYMDGIEYNATTFEEIRARLA